jgi:hypothetical protein
MHIDAEFPDLPETLRERLAATGATDEESVRAALEQDPELRREFDAFLAANQPQIDALVSEAFDRFLAAADSDQLDALAWEVPFLLDESFAQMVLQVAGEAQSAGDADLADGLRARLEGLDAIREQRAIAQGSPLVEALLQFLNAATDDEARALFATSQDLMTSDEAQEILDTGFQGADEESQQRIAQRSELLRTLRAGSV